MVARLGQRRRWKRRWRWRWRCGRRRRVMVRFAFIFPKQFDHCNEQSMYVIIFDWSENNLMWTSCYLKTLLATLHLSLIFLWKFIFVLNSEIYCFFKCKQWQYRCFYPSSYSIVQGWVVVTYDSRPHQNFKLLPKLDRNFNITWIICVEISRTSI